MLLNSTVVCFWAEIEQFRNHFLSFLFTEMNAMIRRIDLSVNILAPIIVGLIMNFASMTVAALYITGWNICSMIVEYFLLLKVYKAVPALSGKTKGGSKTKFSCLL